MSIICWDFFGGVPRFPILNPGPSQRVAPEGSYMYSIDIKVSKIDLAIQLSISVFVRFSPVESHRAAQAVSQASQAGRNICGRMVLSLRSTRDPLEGFAQQKGTPKNIQIHQNPVGYDC